jgi:hypothetical protein
LLSFEKLNHGWNAQPNAPVPITRVLGSDVVVEFVLNHQAFHAFNEEEKGFLRFIEVTKYRLGATNDEGWFRGQCRYSKHAPAWGEFYEITGADEFVDLPNDWKFVNATGTASRHFLFYFRDETFEAICASWRFEPLQENALLRRT